MMNKQKNQLSKFERESKKGSYLASFQLSKMYEEGVFVDADEVRSKEYEKIFSDQVKGNRLRLSQVRLVNFRGFKELEIDFPLNQKSTVIVGNNGCGKSSVLTAARKCFSYLNSAITTNSINGDPIAELDISQGEDFSSVVVTLSLGGESQFKISLNRAHRFSGINKKSDLKGARDLSEIFKLAASHEKGFPLPLLASYSVDRAIDVTTEDIESSLELSNEDYIWDQHKGYQKSLTGKADFKLFFRWYKELVERENSGNSDVRSIKSKIEGKKSDLESPILKQLLSLDEAKDKAQSIINNYKEEIKNLEGSLHDLLREKTSRNSKLLLVVEEAIYSFLPGFSDLSIRRDPLDMVISKKGQTLSVLQLSQGEKSMLALVADIARRLTLLNPNSEKPLSGSGIVLLDEIDLHLHPSWQQRVIKQLESTFPNIQFIITTHSPQVCHTIDSENIWVLKEGRKYSAPKGVRGALSSWVLKSLFEVDNRPPDDKYTKILKEYRELVYSDDYDTEPAQEMKSILADHFGSSADFLVELDMYIENREWEKELEKG